MVIIPSHDDMSRGCSTCCFTIIALFMICINIDNKHNMANGQTTDLSLLFSSVFGPPPDITTETTDSRTPQTVETSCTCVAISLCNTTAMYGAGSIDIRFGLCPDSSKICCSVILEPEEATQRPIQRGGNSCGQRNINGVGFRITSSGNEAQFGEFPWMVALLKVNLADSASYHCGGSLIHPKVVLTATHCVIGQRISDLIVRAGEWDSQNTNEILPYHERNVAEIIMHPKYSSGALINDISLLILTEPFEFAENIDVVCLPRQNEQMDNAECLASGWGKDKFGKDGVYQNVLKRVQVPIVPRDECQRQLRKTKLKETFHLHETFICAGGRPGEDTCEGDGGGPLTCPIEGKIEQYQQMGIIAWGVGCANTIPAAYVNVALFRNWIDEQMHARKLDTSYYNANSSR